MNNVTGMYAYAVCRAWDRVLQRLKITIAITQPWPKLSNCVDFYYYYYGPCVTIIKP